VHCNSIAMEPSSKKAELFCDDSLTSEPNRQQNGFSLFFPISANSFWTRC
jgi:hypothetical protein